MPSRGEVGDNVVAVERGSHRLRAEGDEVIDAHHIWKRVRTVFLPNYAAILQVANISSWTTTSSPSALYVFKLTLSSNN